MLQPRIAILDELDSGLDIDALRACARRIEAATHEDGLGVLAITHYSRLLHELKPDVVHVLARGRIVATGGPELADALERRRLRRLRGRGERGRPTDRRRGARSIPSPDAAGCRGPRPRLRDHSCPCLPAPGSSRSVRCSVSDSSRWASAPSPVRRAVVGAGPAPLVGAASGTADATGTSTSPPSAARASDTAGPAHSKRTSGADLRTGTSARRRRPHSTRRSSSRHFASFDKALASSLIGHGDLAVSVAVARNGQLIHEAAFGVANPSTGEPVDAGGPLPDRQQLQGARRDRHHADGPGRHPAPRRPAAARASPPTWGSPSDPAMASITIRQLLSHTSGFPEYDHTFFGGGAKSCTGRGPQGPDRATCSGRPARSTATAT